MIKKLLLMLLILPLISIGQDKMKIDSLNKKYDSILTVMKKPKMKDSMLVLDKLIFMLQKVDSERFALKHKK
jgi:sporulation-control protein spo0M